LQTVFQSVPNDKFFLETDTVEETIEEVYALAAKYKNIQIEDLVEMVNANFKTIFKSN
jgi:TatD DNase family protein